MNGLLYKTLRREWFAVRWPAWAWLWFRRGLLRLQWGLRAAVRWLQQDIGAWFTEGWGANWIQWRWAGVATVCTFVGVVLYEFVRPFKVVASGLFGEVERRDRKWILPSITGTIGLLLMILLFLSGGPLKSGTDQFPTTQLEDDDELPRTSEVQRMGVVDLGPSIEPQPDLVDPFADPIDVPDPDEPIARREPEPPLIPDVPDPEPVLTVEPFPEPERERPVIEEWPVVDVTPAPEPADLDVAVSRGPASERWQPRLADETDIHVVSGSPLSIDVASLPAGFDADGWERFERPFRDAGLLPVVHTIREYAEATASSTLVRAEVQDPEPPPIQPEPVEPEPVEPEPVDPDPIPPRRVVPEPPPVAAPTPERRIDFVAFMDETTRVGDRCAIEFRAINSGDVDLDDLVVRIDLPPQFDHHLGRRIDYTIGRLAAGATRSARLVVDSIAAGSGSVVVRLEGPEVAKTEERRFEVTAAPEPPRPVAEPSDPEPRRPEPVRPAPRRRPTTTAAPVSSPPTFVCPPFPCYPF